MSTEVTFQLDGSSIKTFDDIYATAEVKSVDVVNHPTHYETGGIECIDAMLITQGKEATKAFCICNAFKYLWRHNNKNGLEDLKKAQWYINKAIELEGKDNEKT